MGRGKNLHLAGPTPRLRVSRVPKSGRTKTTASGVLIEKKCYRDGSYEWKDKKGRRHCEDGPAFRSERQKADSYFRQGKLHRTDGPAVEFDNGNGKVWAIDGEIFHFEEHYLEARAHWILQQRAKAA